MNSKIEAARLACLSLERGRQGFAELRSALTVHALLVRGLGSDQDLARIFWGGACERNCRKVYYFCKESVTVMTTMG
jgi:hypothetical protein